MGKTYLVVGSNCFTGSHIVDALLADPSNRVIGTSRSPEYKDIFLPYKARPNAAFEFHRIDSVSEFPKLSALIDASKPSVVVNVAALSEVALSNERPVEYFEINTLAVVKLCEHLRGKPFLERYVHISSAEILGSCPKPIAEDALFKPSTPYAVSKAAADMHLDVLIKNTKFPATLIRSTNVYGRHQQLFKIIPRCVINLKLGKPIRLEGGGKAMKSFIHIRDVVRGLLTSLEKGGPGVYHFSVESSQTVADVVRAVCEAMGRDFTKAVELAPDRVGQDARYTLDCSKARRELGWAPREDFEKGVREVIDWIEANWDAVRQEPLEYKHKT
ncbi:MAG: GDP-mannose 4,6-dehydratase [Elusimicrobia bacterium]|nr:GDP-mannose 4,6-dehydratase [Elusimicrobiota bacterium]